MRAEGQEIEGLCNEVRQLREKQKRDKRRAENQLLRTRAGTAGAPFLTRGARLGELTWHSRGGHSIQPRTSWYCVSEIVLRWFRRISETQHQTVELQPALSVLQSVAL